MADNRWQKIFQPSSRGKLWWIFVLIIILTLAGSLVVFGSYYNQFLVKTQFPLPQVGQVPFRLGLDLLGGTQLVYQADVSAIAASDRSNAMEGVRDVIERRINVFGVSEPNVQLNKTAGGEYRVILELAGIKDVKEAIKMIGETPLLEFKEENTEARQLTDQERKQLDDFNSQAEKKAEEVLGKLIAGGDFSALAREYSQDDKTKASGGDLGWVSAKDKVELFNLAKKIGVGKTSQDLARLSQGFEIIKVEGEKTKTDAFTGQEEKEIKAAHLLVCYQGKTGCESDLTKEQAEEKIKKLKEQAKPENFTDLVKQNSTEPAARENGGELDWFGRGQMAKPFEEAVFYQPVGAIAGPVETDFGFHLIYKQEERKVIEYQLKHIFVKTKSEEDIIGKQSEWKNTELTGKNLKTAKVQFNPNDNSPEVSLEFDNDGAKLFEQITERNVSKPVAIFLDSYPISVPTVNEKISGGKAVITGKFNIKEAKLLAQRLNAGALPVPIQLVNQQTIGPSLGQKSVADSLRAGMIGFIVVVLFMILFYRLPGLVSVLALIVYALLVLAIFKLWPVTLTLAGLAGFILSIGMAVDANILIFARMKEEIAHGKPLTSAIGDGFRRAWPSIRDSNFNTLITCFILIQFTTSVVRGFAVTLALGVLVSMFTAIFITRNFLSLIPSSWLEKKAWLISSTKIIK